MFTGIVEETGKVVEVTDGPEGRRIRVAASFCEELEHGQSVAVAGACLTVEDRTPTDFELFCSQETLERTYLGTVGVGDRVNLERALPADGRLDGHFVQGHVDGVGEVTEVERVRGGSASEASGASPEADEAGGDWVFGFSLPADLEPYVVEKGSIAVDGISLTVAHLRDEDFTVAIIPASYELTTLSEKAVGDPVHLEVDVVAKYVESLTEGYR